MSLPASYCTVADVYARFPNLGSVTAITSAHVAEAIGAEQARVDVKLCERYPVPFAPCPPILTAITADLATYRLIGTRRLMPDDQESKDWLVPFKQAGELLDRLSSGRISLPSGSGTVIEQIGPGIGEVFHTAVNTPQFVGQRFEDVDHCYVPSRDWNR